MTETKNLRDQIRDWAEKTFAFYIEEDKKQNKGFYTQSPLNNITSNPEIIVMGINPGSDGAFNKDFSVEEFLKGNIEWDKHRNWKYTQRIEYFLMKWLEDRAEEIFSDDNQIIYINASCFQTSKASALGYDLLQKSLPHTIKLIELLKPKLLLCFSAKKFFCIEKSIERINLTDDIILGTIGNIPIIGVPHPSARLTSAKREYIRQVIALAMEHSHLNIVDKAKLINERVQFKEKKVSYSAPDILKLAKNEIISILGNTLKDWEKTLCFPLNKELEFRITLCEKGYVGIRHISFDSKIKYPNDIYPNWEKYANVLRKFGFKVLPKNGVWIGTKRFREFGYDNNSITENIAVEIKKIKELVSTI